MLSEAFQLNVFRYYRMRICAAQTKPVTGEIETNIDYHKKLIDLAVSYGTDLIVFPELSLTGYEPRLAEELATTPGDERLTVFQTISDLCHIAIGVGIPVRNYAGILITMIIFQPHRSKEVYSKQHLHIDEYPYFITGRKQILLSVGENKIAPAICYELSVPAHSENAFNMGAQIYMASVAKSADGVKKAINDLSAIASKYSMTAVMSNCIGVCDGVECAGQTTIWSSAGLVAAQLDDKKEGILIIDTATGQLIEKTI